MSTLGATKAHLERRRRDAIVDWLLHRRIRRRITVTYAFRTVRVGDTVRVNNADYRIVDIYDRDFFPPGRTDWPEYIGFTAQHSGPDEAGDRREHQP